MGYGGTFAPINGLLWVLGFHLLEAGLGVDADDVEAELQLEAREAKGDADRFGGSSKTVRVPSSF